MYFEGADTALIATHDGWLAQSIRGIVSLSTVQHKFRKAMIPTWSPRWTACVASFIVAKNQLHICTKCDGWKTSASFMWWIIIVISLWKADIDQRPARVQYLLVVCITKNIGIWFLKVYLHATTSMIPAESSYAQARPSIENRCFGKPTLSLGCAKYRNDSQSTCSDGWSIYDTEWLGKWMLHSFYFWPTSDP